MKNNRSINKFDGKIEPLKKRVKSNSINNNNNRNNNNRNNSSINNNKNQQKKNEVLMPRIRNNRYKNDNYNYLANQNRSQEINYYNKKYNIKSRSRSKSARRLPNKSNSSSNIRRSNSNNNIINSKQRVGRNNSRGNKNIMIEVNNSYIYNKRNNNINGGIKKNKYEYITRSEEKPLKIKNQLEKNPKRNNFNIQNNKIMRSPSNNIIKNKKINKENYFLYDNKKNVNNRVFNNNKKIKLPIIISSPSSKNRRHKNNYQRIKTFTPNYQIQNKNQDFFNKNNYQKRPENMKLNALKKLNYIKAKPHTFQNDSIVKKKILSRKNLDSSSNRIVLNNKPNIRNNFFGQYNERIKSIKNNMLNPNLINKIMKSQSFVDSSNKINNNNNNNNLRNRNSNKLINSNKELYINRNNNYVNNPFYNNNNNNDNKANYYYMNNLRNSYDNNYYAMDNNNYYNNMNNLFNNNNPNKRNIIFNNRKNNNNTIKNYINNYDVKQKMNIVNENSQHNIQEDIRSYTSFNNPPLLLPNIQSNNDYGKYNMNMNNNYLDDNKDNVLDVLMSQRLNYQSKIPNDSRFKIKLLKSSNFY